MLKRLTSVSLTLLAVSGSVQAFTLGQIHVQSFINEPLKAVIDVKSATPADIKALKIKLASKQAFKSAGVDWSFDLNSLQFNLIETKKGPKIEVTTKYPISEPYLSFVIDAAWQKGNLIKDYTLLLDPPIYTERLSAPVAAADVGTVIEEESPPVVAEAEPVVKAEPEPKSEDVKQPKPKPVEKTKPAEPVAALSDGDSVGPTVGGDNLWNIAKKVRPVGASIQQTIIAIHEANRGAFMRGNMNLLKKGQVLRIPPAEVIEAISQAAAEGRLTRHEKAWRAGRAIADKKRLSPEYIATTEPKEAPAVTKSKEESAREAESIAAQTSTSSVQDAEGRLVLASADEQEKAGLSGEGSGDELSEAMQGAVKSAEQEASEANEQSSNLKADVDSLEGEIDDAKKLLELKDDQLSKLQEFYEELNEQEKAVQTSEDAEVMGGSGDAEEVVAEAETETQAMPDVAEVAENETQVAAVDTEIPLEEAGAGAMTETAASSAETAQDETASAPEEAAVAAAAPEAQKGLLEKTAESLGLPAWVTDKTNLMFGAGGLGVIFLGLIGFVFMRRRGKSGDAKNDDNILISDLEREAAQVPDTAIPEVAATPDKIIADPIERATALMSYKEYDRANEILDEAIKAQPENFDLHVKQLEVMHASGDSAGFAEHYGILDRANFKVLDPEKWNYVEGMHKELGIEEVAAVESSSGFASSDFLDDAEQDSDLQEFNVTEINEDAFAVPETIEADLESAADDSLEDVADTLSEQEHDMSEFTLETEGETEIEVALEPEPQEIEAPEFDLADDVDDMTDEVSEAIADVSETDVLDDNEFDLSEFGADLEEEAGQETAVDEQDLNEFDLSEFAADTVTEPELTEDVVKEEFDLSNFATDTEDNQIDELDLSDFTFDSSSEVAESVDEVAGSEEGDSGDLEEALKMFEMELDGGKTDAEAVDEAQTASAETADILEDSGDDFGAVLEEPLLNTDDTVDSAPESDEEIQAKIELAEAFAEMGDVEGAREILNEVLAEGNADQKQMAENVLEKYS